MGRREVWVAALTEELQSEATVGFFSDPFGLRSIRRDLKLAQVLVGSFVFFVFMYLNCLSQAWLEKVMGSYYHDRWKPVHPSSKALLMWDIGHAILPPPPFNDIFPWSDFLTEKLTAFVILRIVIFPGPRSMRWMVLRRTLFLLGILYGIRGPCILFTLLPNPDQTCVHWYSMNNLALDNLYLVAFKVWTRQILTCTDVMFSGHTLLLTICTLTIVEYTPMAPLVRVPPPEAAGDRGGRSGIQQFFFELVYSDRAWTFFWAFYLVWSYYCIIASHFHYTRDVIVGVVLCFTTHYGYTSLVRVAAGSQASWARMLTWFECDARDVRMYHRIQRHEASLDNLISCSETG